MSLSTVNAAIAPVGSALAPAVAAASVPGYPQGLCWRMQVEGALASEEAAMVRLREPVRVMGGMTARVFTGIGLLW